MPDQAARKTVSNPPGGAAVLKPYYANAGTSTRTRAPVGDQEGGHHGSN